MGAWPYAQLTNVQIAGAPQLIAAGPHLIASPYHLIAPHTTVVQGAQLVHAPAVVHASPVVYAAPIPIVKAEAQYTAATLGAVHTAPLPGHDVSQAILNLAPAPGTL